MPVFSQNITVDLSVELTNNVLNSVHVNQYEHKSREIHIYVKKDGIDYPIPNDLTVNIRIHKSNGYDIYKTIGKDIGTINENIITILIDESMTIASGRQTCDIEFIDSNDNRLYSTKFYINVHKSALDDNNIKDNDDYSTVQSLARESKEYANLSKSYAVGTNNEIRENDSIDNAKYYKEQSEINADNTLQYSENAKTSANNADSSAINAQKSEIASKTSEQNAKASEVAAKESETNSKSSENASKISETNASNSASISTEKAIAASDYADNAANSAETAEEAKSSAEEAKNTATSKASEAATSADNASRDAQQSANSARQASESAMTASDKASQATDSAAKAESFAHGGTDTRENEDIDNAKYYYEQAKSISESFSGSLRPMGTINFSLFVDTVMSTATEGDMYNISDEFTTNANFKEGSGLTIPAGANIYKTTDGMWDVLAGSPVTSVNSMRGNVNITPASIKALPDTTKYAGSDSIGGAANTAMQVNGTYTGSGGQQPPSYVTSGKTRFNMWNAFKGIANPAGGYMDVILMDNYTGSDVPYVTGIGVTKNNGNPRMFIANGTKGGTGNWAHQVEVITTANISSQTVGSATKATQDGNGNIIKDTYVKGDTDRIVIGRNASAGGAASTALGSNAKARGTQSTALGRSANAVGIDSTALGRNASAGGSGSTALGYSAMVSSSDSDVIQIGNSIASALRCRVALSVTSDIRDKTDINNITNATEFLNKINPFTYVSNARDLYSKEKLTDEEEENYKKYGFKPYDKAAHEQGIKKGERQRVGVSAQNVQEALTKVYGSADYANLVNDNLHDVDPSEIPEGVESHLTVTYESFIPFLIKAVQELSEKNKELHARIEMLENKNTF